jgi:DNA invertase Pin-like site-specific DNA recombinase
MNVAPAHRFKWGDSTADNELVRNVLLAVMSSLAKVEAQKIGERTKAGMARAKAAGKRIGRPTLPQGRLDFALCSNTLKLLALPRGVPQFNEINMF